MESNKIKAYSEKAKDLRVRTLELIAKRKEGHIGGAFSIIEILTSLYGVHPDYKGILQEDDKFILSKGHACIPYYLLLRERGFNPKISGHPERDIENGIYCTTGSLGHGLPMGVGMAMGKKLKGDSGNIYVLMSEGDCQEGTAWECMLQAPHRKLNNLTAIVDYNGLQTLGKVDEILSLKSLPNVFESCGWDVQKISGHSFEEIDFALRNNTQEKPKAIIAYTTKGKGVSFMENESGWHTMVPNEEELKRAYEELK